MNMKEKLQDKELRAQGASEKKPLQDAVQTNKNQPGNPEKDVENWKWFKWIYKWRYAEALLILVVCVLFEISGSSIGSWSVFLDGTYDRPSAEMSGDELGKFRTIRSDEWAVNTPMAFSQYYNQTGGFPYFSDTIRGDKTDAFIVYGQPVKSWEMIFRPFQTGYLFLEPSRGLSFFWCGRFLALLLVSLEFGMYLTRKKKLLSVVYSLLLTCSPLVAWWFAINGLVEMFIFGQLAILLFIRWMYASQLWKKLLYMVGVAWCGVTYILLFYPSWQLPFGFAYVFLVIGIFLREKKYVIWKKNQVILSVGALITSMAVPLAAIFYKSWDTINLVLNTAYPGNRIFLEERAWFKLFNWPMGLFFPYIDPIYSKFNVCEAAVIFSFFPAGVILGIVWIIKNRKKDPLLISMLAGVGFLLLYSAVRLPQGLAKVTLQDMTMGRRAIDAVGFLSLILLIYVVAKGAQRIRFKRTVCVSIAGAAVMAIINFYLNTEYIGFKGTFTLFAAMAMGMLFFVFAMKRKRYGGLVVYTVLIALAAGGTVNPVHRGVDSIYSNKLFQAIREETLEDEGKGLWIVENLPFPYHNIPMMAGAPTINSTNVYPNLERWEKLDSNKQYEEVYNRYAHISINVVDETSEEPVFTAPYPDQVQIRLRPEQLKVLDVAYILTDQDLSRFNRPDVSFEKEAQVGGYYIYNVSYS